MIAFKRALRPLALFLIAACLSLPAWAQEKPANTLVSIYHIVPGKQLDFLKWQAARDAVDREAGVPQTQWYAHMDGDSWDYVSIAPEVDEATQDKLDELAKKHGLKTGPKAGLEFRSMVASHTDTFTAGPMTSTQLVERLTTP